MPKLRFEIGDQLNEAELQEGFTTLASDKEFLQFIKAMLNLIKSGHLGFWLSPQLMRKLKAFAESQEGYNSQTKEINDTIFFSWLQQGGSMQPPIDWQVEMLPNNGSIYRMLLEGGQDGKGVHDNPS
jgi:hypothetical protein